MLLFQQIFVIILHTALANKKKEYYDVNNWESLTASFESFLQEHDKNYVTIEKVQRINIFRETLIEINRLNDEHPNTIFGITYFADLTAEEIKRYKGYLPSTDTGLCAGDPKTRDAPTAYDWRQHGAVTPVKDQKDCGSCWAFSTTATVESRHAMKTGQQLDLSEQQLLDCNSGFISLAFTTLIEEGGLELEADYPYIAERCTCQFDSSKVAVKVASCNTYNLSSEDTMKELLFKEGPLAIAVASKPFEVYHGGILNTCAYANVDHAAQLVGYGSENGVDYWTIKNSWGPTWGERGFIRIQRGVQCLNLLNREVLSATLA